MKVNELRIGNMIQYYDDICRIESICGTTNLVLASGDVNGYKDCGLDCSIDTVNPIPLNEYWLLKFGFEKNGVYFDKYTNKNAIDQRENKRLRIIDFEYAATCEYSRFFLFMYGKHTLSAPCEDVVIKYVHQLQNLYYILTGEELS